MPRTRPVRSVTLLLAMAFLVWPTDAGARCLTEILPGDNVRSRWDQACIDGCSIRFAPGVHTTTSRLGCSFAGTAADPVIVEGESAATTRLVRPAPDQNLVDISGQHFILRNLELEGGSIGVRLEFSTEDAEFSNLEIHGSDSSAFTANRIGETYRNLRIVDNEIYSTAGLGEGLYLGCNNNACTFGDSVVERNLIYDTASSAGSSQGDGIDLKGGSFNVLVRDNVIRDTAGPGILAYANGSGPQNVIERNFIWNPGNVGIQATGDVRVANNVVIDTQVGTDFPLINASATNQLPPGTVPTNFQILHNTVVRTEAQGQSCVQIRGWGQQGVEMALAGNAVFCPGAVQGAIFANTDLEFATVEDNAVDVPPSFPQGWFLVGSSQRELVDAAHGDAYPAEGAGLLAGVDPALTPASDFNCLLYDPGAQAQDAGAYRFVGAGNPGWVPAATFKTCLDACSGPVEPVRITEADKNRGAIVLTAEDPNPAWTVTGYTVYRSGDPSLAPAQWPVVAGDVVDDDPDTPGLQWTDTDPGPNPSEVWFYELTADNGACGSQSPR